MPQYRYAYDLQGHLIDVLDLPSQRDELAAGFLCVGCGQPLIAKTKGEKREKHFVHKVITPTCTEETYLHKLAKQVFLDEYRTCLERNERFEIELNYPKTCSRFAELLGDTCRIGWFTKAHDLTTYYDSIVLEQRDDRFVPNLLLYNSANPALRLYIEIAVTHFLSEPKASSDHRIIELPVESEANIEKIRSRRITEADARFVDFHRDGVPGVDGECTCAQRAYYCLVIYTSRKAFLFHDPLALIEDKRRRLGGKVAYARLLPGEDLALDAFRGEVFAGLIREAHERGFPVRNCFVCRFQGVPWDWADSQVHAPIYCKLLKKRCASNDAVECPKFYTVEKLPSRPS